MSNIVAPIGVGIQNILNNLFRENKNDGKKERVYVVGNGWGSYFFVKNLDKSKYYPIIIAPNTKVLNTPKLTNLLIDPDAKVEFDNPHAEIILDMVEDINVEKKCLITKSGAIYPYNNVVLSIGSEPNDFGIPGVNSHTYKFKTIADANLLRDKINNISINNQIYVIGSGITGIEIASKLGKVFNVKVIEGLGTILPGYNDSTKNVIWNHLKQTQRYINIETNTMVKSIGDNQINVSKINLNKNTSELTQWKFNTKKDLIIWSGGVRFNGFGAKTVLFNTLNSITPIKPRGLEVGDDFGIGNNLGIYCVGDMVANKGPSSAQNAKIQGEYLARYFNSGFDKEFLKTNKFESTSKGKLVHLVSDTYLESEYYSGFVPGFINDIIEWLNI
jgi:NADH dehydrogenase FAD-containing subunit